jgi:hypothetical protein
LGGEEVSGMARGDESCIDTSRDNGIGGASVCLPAAVNMPEINRNKRPSFQLPLYKLFLIVGAWAASIGLFERVGGQWRLTSLLVAGVATALICCAHRGNLPSVLEFGVFTLLGTIAGAARLRGSLVDLLAGDSDTITPQIGAAATTIGAGLGAICGALIGAFVRSLRSSPAREK